MSGPDISDISDISFRPRRAHPQMSGAANPNPQPRTLNLEVPQIPSFTDENMPADGESPTQDGEADGEWPLRTANRLDRTARTAIFQT
jgi:hypothetical protein